MRMSENLSNGRHLIYVNVVALVDPTIDAAKQCPNGISHAETPRAVSKSRRHPRDRGGVIMKRILQLAFLALALCWGADMATAFNLSKSDRSGSSVRALEHKL